jgi:hypothetical protein
MRQPELRWRVLWLILLLAVAGCQTRRPDFMTRVREDCAGGDKGACDLIDALNRPIQTNGLDPRDDVGQSHDAR